MPLDDRVHGIDRCFFGKILQLEGDLIELALQEAIIGANFGRKTEFG
ncbi:MAG: hypothetical protein KJ867_04420 [Gammaproteobacteria bacterium]|nr:hypothetical protein [Gammaproteobacteria bacterium]